MTADTDEFKPGDRATWMRVQRGGYGYVVPVPCTIEQLPEAGGRVRIRVVKADGVIAYRSNSAAPLGVGWNEGLGACPDSRADV